MNSSGEVTGLLSAVRAGEPGALEDLFSLVYEQLKTLAHARRLHWRGDETLDTTALVHEAYLKLVRAEDADWEDRAHFFAVASRAMRQILVNYARRRRTQKRGGGAQVVSLDEVNPVAPEAADDLLALNEALDRLDETHARQRQVVEFRFFAGLTIHETAEVLAVSTATVERDWRVARAWLRREVGGALALIPEPETEA